MGSVFDGMGTLIAGTLGEVVSVTPPGGIARDEVGIFREGPMLVLGQDGAEITTIIPTLKIDHRQGVDLVPDGLVMPGNGNIYRCVSSQPSGNPGEDSMIIIRLERV